jgi:hypothetical protein
MEFNVGLIQTSRLAQVAATALALMTLPLMGNLAMVEPSGDAGDVNVQAQSEVHVALSALDYAIAKASPPLDVEMAWSDLRDDTSSIVDDLLYRPDDVDSQAMLGRITSFWNSYERTDQLGPAMPEWQVFVEAFQSLASSTGSIAATDGPVEETRSVG